MRVFGTSKAFACKSSEIFARAALIVAKGQAPLGQKSS